MTWGELVQKTNDWLSFKRKAAEGVSELPNLQDVCEWVERTLIARLESDNKVNGEKSIFQLAKKCNLDIQEADLRTVTLLDVQAHELILTGAVACNNSEVFNHEGKVAMITVGAWTEEYLNPLFRVAVLHKDVDGVDIPTSVVTIVPKENTDVWSAVVDAIALQRKQQTAGRDVISRWSMAPQSYRRKHIICPCCGSSKVRNMDDGLGGKDWVGCDECHWESTPGVIEAVWDLANREWFLDEVGREGEKRKIAGEVTETVSAIKALTGKLSGMLNEYRKMDPANKSMVKDVRDIIASLEKAAEAIEATPKKS